MTSLVNQGFAPVTLDEAMKFSEMLAKSSMVPRAYQGKAEDILVACQWGREIGLAPMQALQNIAVINGKPSVYGDAAMALVQASSVCEDIEEYIEGEGTTNPVAVCVAHRKGRKPVKATFSVEDAKRAGLWGKQGPWTAYPKRMMQMRARGFALRDAFPDVLKGLITAEEAADYPEVKDITPAPSRPSNPLDALASPAAVTVTPIGTWSAEAEPSELKEVLDDSNDIATQVMEEMAEDLEAADPPDYLKTFDLAIPGKPTQSFPSSKEWSNSYEEIGAKVMAAKIDSAVKLEKLDALREANKATLSKLDITERVAHTQSYSKRKAELGAG